MDRFEEMTMFVAVVHEQGFAAAARKLAVSAASATRAVAALETRIGTVLLNRTTRGIRLTEAGERYFEDCKRLLADLAEAEQSAGGALAAPRGLLVVTAPVLFGQMYVMPLLRSFLDQQPAVDARAVFVDRVISMLDDGIDVAFRIAHPADSSLVALPVGHVRRVICAAPSLLERLGVPQHPRDLSGCRIVMAAAVTPAPEWSFREAGETISVRVNPTLWVSNNQAAIQSAEQGWGVTRVLSYQIAHQLAAGTLRVVLKEFELPPIPVNITYDDSRRTSTKVSRFVEHAAAQLRAHSTFG